MVFNGRYRKYLPKIPTDWMAFIFTLAMMHVVAAFELFVVLPYIDEKGGEAYWLHVVLGLFLYMNTMCSLYYCMFIDATSGDIVLPSILRPGWRFCSSCEANAPPRSFHCWICRRCILARDHHCVFTGNCIGHTNRRYFLLFVLNVWLGATYSCFLHVDYVLEVLHGFTWQALVTMIAPMVTWTTGLSKDFNFLVSFISSTTLIASLFVGLFFMYHLRNVLSGQTVHEKANNIKDFDYGWRSNLEYVFGKNWKFAWISPLITSPLPSDGIEHKRKGTMEEVKDI